MSRDNRDRAIKSLELELGALGKLLPIAQSLAPDRWPLQILRESDGFRAVVSNGDDNVTGIGKTAQGAVAHLIGYLLDGGVRPLGNGTGGKYVWPDEEDEGPEEELPGRHFMSASSDPHQ